MYRLSWSGAAVFLAVVLAVPAAMLAASSPSPGIYVEMPGKSGDDAKVKLQGVMVTNISEKGAWKMALSQGFAKGAMVATIDGSSAAVRVPAGNIAFDFLLDPRPGGGNSAASMDEMMKAMSGEGMPATARSADDFQLLHLTPKAHTREVQIGTQGRGGMSSKTKDAVPCVIEKVGEREFRVRPKDPLEPGEYAFSYSTQDRGSQLWDFGVDK